MGTAITLIIVLLVIVAVIALVAMSAYNGFVKSRNLIQESWRQVDVELNRRYELIPNLVETVRAYAAHERNTLEDITRLRSQAQQLSQAEGGLPTQQRADVEAALSGAVRNLIVSVEAYPDLKSNTNFLELQRQLAETEDRIANGRRYYNANVRVYNTKVESVPTNIVANIFKFEKATYFEVNDPEVRQAPNVSFGEIAYRGDPQQAPQHPQQGQLPQQGFGPGYGGGNALPNPPQQQYGQQQYAPPPQQYQQQQYNQPPQQYNQPPQQYGQVPQQQYGKPQYGQQPPQQQYGQPPQQQYAPPPYGQQPGQQYAPPAQSGYVPPSYGQSPAQPAQGYVPPQTGPQSGQPTAQSASSAQSAPQSPESAPPSSPESAPPSYQPPSSGQPSESGDSGGSRGYQPPSTT